MNPTTTTMEEADSIQASHPSFRSEKSCAKPVHVTALDEVVSINSFFTVAVFLGITLTSASKLQLGAAPNSASCIAGADTFRRLILHEVVAFSCFQFSSLIAHSLKLVLVAKHCRHSSSSSSISGGAAIVSLNQRLLRFGILASALGSAAGTLFLMLSLIDYIQMRFGKLRCADPFLLQSAVPLLILVPSGIAVFVGSILYSFLHKS